MSPSDQNDILQWNEAQSSLVMEFALKNAEAYFNDNSICSYARFDQEFFEPLVTEFNKKFSTQATSSTLAACFCNLKEGYLYYDQKLVEFPDMGWFRVDKVMAMVINSHTYRAWFEKDVKKYPGLKSWVWDNTAYMVCPYINEIERLENMVGNYCKEWVSGDSDEGSSTEDDFDDFDDSDDSTRLSTRQKLRSLARSKCAIQQK